MSAPEPLRTELARRLRQAQAEWRAPSVTAAIASGGEIAWCDAVGVADVETGEEATPDHQYRVGSITKTFTAVAIMQLRDEGKLDLDDPLDRHLPGAARTPTIRRMLSHLSGLQREPPGDVWETMKFVSGEELVAGLGEAEQVLPGGAQYHYSNLAFALLGEVVVRLAGRPYVEHVQERILDPLGMTRTSFAPQPPAAKGYFVEPYFDGVRAEASVETGGTAAAGQLWSTTADLCRWAGFFAEPDERVLARATVDEMWRFQAMADLEHWTYGFGLGLMLFREGERIFAGHGGAMPGFLASFVAARKERVGAVVFTNSSAGATPDALARELTARAADELAPAPDGWRVQEPPPEELRGVLGRWWSEGREFVFRFRDGKLQAEIAEPSRAVEPSVFERLDADRYRCVEGNERGELLRIVRDGDGTVTKLYFATYPFTRDAQIFGS